MKVLDKLGFWCFSVLAVGLAFGWGGVSDVSALSVRLQDNRESPQTIVITRQLEDAAVAVNNRFYYTLTPADGNPGTVSGLPDDVSLLFFTSQEENATEQTATINLGAATFSEIGDYKIILRETGSDSVDNYPIDNMHEYYIYVSVRNKTDANGSPTGEYTATLAAQVRDHDAGDKVEAVFSGSAVRNFIKLSKEVSGNLGNSEEYFKFKVNFVGLNSSDYIHVNGQDAVITYGGETITTTDELFVGRNCYVYLKHGQEITIGVKDGQYQIPIGARISIQELGAGDYTIYADGELANTTALKTITNEADGTSYSFHNHREADVLTGIAMDVLPFVGLCIVAVGVAIAVIIVIKKSKR